MDRHGCALLDCRRFIALQLAPGLDLLVSCSRHLPSSGRHFCRPSKRRSSVGNGSLQHAGLNKRAACSTSLRRRWVTTISALLACACNAADPEHRNPPSQGLTFLARPPYAQSKRTLQSRRSPDPHPREDTLDIRIGKPTRIASMELLRDVSAVLSYRPLAELAARAIECLPSFVRC